MTEFDFIRKYLQNQQQDHQVVLGIGDDAAIIRPQAEYDLCFSADMLLKNRHFFENVAPEDLAWKVLAVNLSDMAAMGAQPRWALLSAGLPELNEDWLRRFCNSLFDLAQRFGVTLIGGDTTRGDLVFNVTIVGELPQGKSLRRDAAQVGDDIWVSGKIGLAASALNCLLKQCDLPSEVFQLCEAELLRPMPRVRLGQAILNFAHAAQDVSDGLAQDIDHILTASNVGAEIWADEIPTLPQLKKVLPRKEWLQYTLAGGDDYELVFTAPKNCREALLIAAQNSNTPITCIGKITDSGCLQVINSMADRMEIALTSLGFDHFG
ncbi:thiamine-phosphate kinase [Neisseria sp. N95_16]|uniref:Thiamine-monophosphate kinase n=1 Tax=Neisseria brasiliensis TaxID=2666100 RepID=A0A5Q3S3N2_9NEIS|nr:MULTISPECIES: thiamine-phosphate kinase [Neisseria]MRN38657.1 thiamine-phosphate kinase [Neisseria brasiliensis]PJO09347.1 thiamine-phosphate kinase [Neisseria sp. N95_16]PJO78722.1 thiamine-phosphate kinase [Neisseria sp. N177_16]QGL25564.1 thiamine-phosphate kinase [Neisseria brasiliensis]